MMNYITGTTIRNLREKKQITQRALAEQLKVSDKTVGQGTVLNGIKFV